MVIKLNKGEELLIDVNGSLFEVYVSEADDTNSSKDTIYIHKRKLEGESTLATEAFEVVNKVHGGCVVLR